MCQDAVYQLIFQCFREIRDLFCQIMHHLGTDDDMSQKLSFICIIIHREGRKFLCLADIMKQRCCDQKVSLEKRISICHIVTELCNA